MGREATTTPISFVVCVSDNGILSANLLASPCLGSDSPHEVIAIRAAPNAAVGLNLGLEKAGISQQRYVKFRGSGQASVASTSDLRVSQSFVCETLEKCCVS
jgi:hypothetical protein